MAGTISVVIAPHRLEDAAVMRQYTETLGLGDSEQDDLQATLGKLLLWAEVRGHIKSNPFSTKAAA